MKRLEGKNIIIIGGTSGIGYSSAIKLATNGANIIISGRDDVMGASIVREIKKIGVKAKYIKCDITNKHQIKNMFDEALLFFDRIHCAFNNAGIEGEISLFTESTEENFDKVMDTNLKGTWWCLRYEIDHMLANGGGNIINMSSTSGVAGNGFGMTAYAASKHAIVGLTKSIALEYAKQNIRINALCPAFVETLMVDSICEKNPKLRRRFEACQPMGRMAKPEEIADAVLFLSSDESKFITGNSFIIDGGLTA